MNEVTSEVESEVVAGLDLGGQDETVATETSINEAGVPETVEVEVSEVKVAEEVASPFEVGDIFKVSGHQVIIIKEKKLTTTVCESIAVDPKTLKVNANELILANLQLEKSIKRGTYIFIPISIHSILDDLASL